MRYLFLLTLYLLTSPLAVLAAVPTDYGFSSIQRTPYDNNGKYASWCTDFSDGYIQHFVPLTFTDVNNLPYVVATTTVQDSNTFYWDSSSSCNVKSSYYNNIPAQSFMPDESQHYRLYYFSGDSDFVPSGTTTSNYNSRWVGAHDYDNYDSLTAQSVNEANGPENNYNVSESYTYNGVTYHVSALFLSGFPTSTSGIPLNNRGLPYEQDMYTSYDKYTELYAIVYTNTDLLSIFSNSSDVVTYLQNLNGVADSGSTTPSTPNQSLWPGIVRVYSPAHGSVRPVNSSGNATVTFKYSYNNTSSSSVAGIELSNLSLGQSLVTPQKTIISVSDFYEYSMILDAGHYAWRPVLLDSSGNVTDYYQAGRYFNFTLYGSTEQFLGDYYVSSTSASTTFSVFGDIVATSSYNIGSSTFYISDMNISIPDLGNGVCGVNMSCYSPMCIEYPNLCDKFPFAYAIDFLTIVRNWNESLTGGVLTISLPTAFASDTSLTVLDLSEGTYARSLADKTHFWASALIWLVFGFWSFSLANRFIS